MMNSDVFLEYRQLVGERMLGLLRERGQLVGFIPRRLIG